MATIRYIAPVLAAAVGVATAQSCGGTTTISSAAQATGLSNLCGSRSFAGDIIIAEETTDSIALNTITGIQGSLLANGVSGMASLSADSIKTIGEFNLQELTSLTQLSFPALVKVGTLQWTTLPNLAGLSFSQNGVQEIDSLSIADTQLSTLDGINLQTADSIEITQNGQLQMVNMQIANISGMLSITDNGNMLQAEFPNLIWANNMSFRALSSVSIPSLASVNGSLGFYESGIESLSAPNLTKVGGDLSVVDCDSLTNITMPSLTNIGGGFQLANNTKLDQITGFPDVASVGGALDFNGDYSSVELPALKNVRGAFNLQSTQNINTICDHFSGMQGRDDVIKGSYTCTQTNDPTGVDGNPDGTSSGSGSSTTSSAAYPMLIPSATTGLLGVVAAIFGLL